MSNPVINPQPPYKKPPILEAVIAVHFSEPLELKWIDAFALKRKARFSRAEDMVEISATFHPQSAQSASNIKKIGRKLTDAGGSSVIIITATQMGIIQLAPYTDWDTLYREAREHWDLLAKIMKRRAVSHVSTRYVNRIDIPVGLNEQLDLHRYFNIGLSLPAYAQALNLNTFNISSELVHSSGNHKYVLQLAYVTSPLIDHMSFTLDIDISSVGLVPVNEDRMWELIGSLREYKNKLFEACITPETRKLFQ
jgi:uncharacterized protein (TIGR04255 family)